MEKTQTKQASITDTMNTKCRCTQDFIDFGTSKIFTLIHSLVPILIAEQPDGLPSKWYTIMSKIMKLDSKISSKIFREHSRTQAQASRTNSHLIALDIQRPDKTIHRLHDALLPFTTSCHIPPNRLLTASLGGEGIIWLITSGSLSTYRMHDDLQLNIAEGPLVCGLQEIFTPFRRHYYRVSKGSTLSYMSATLAYNTLNDLGLWADVARTLAYYMRMMVYRDEHLVSHSSYISIRAKLIEYMAKREILIRNRIGIVAYIQSTTHLSRSLIYHVLSALTEGGYIKTNKGKLTEVFHLPENF